MYFERQKARNEERQRQKTQREMVPYHHVLVSWPSVQNPLQNLVHPRHLTEVYTSWINLIQNQQPPKQKESGE